MFTFMLLLVIAITGYGIVRFFIKNKEARTEFFSQVEEDSKKLKKSTKKLVSKAEQRIKKK